MKRVERSFFLILMFFCVLRLSIDVQVQDDVSSSYLPASEELGEEMTEK